MAGSALRPTFLVALSGLCLLVGGALGWFLRAPGAAPTTTVTGTTTRMGGYAFVRPLLECDVATNSDALRFRRLHEELNAAVTRDIATGAATHISVYLRDLNSTEVLGIGESEGFSPASLLKVPILMMALRAAERDSELLERSVLFDVGAERTLNQNIPPTRALERGQKYALWALIEQMIVESDNTAMDAVGAQFSPAEYIRTFADLGVPAPIGASDPLMTVEQYASFFRILYNAAYLGPEMSEKALNLLSRVRFVKGLVAGIPPTVPVAHKFGERRFAPESGAAVNQLHDCGVIYFPGRPYLLCLMTRGNDWNSLAESLRELSTMVYAHYESVANAAQGVASSGSP
jgi:beta-lactamase class A